MWRALLALGRRRSSPAARALSLACVCSLKIGNEPKEQAGSSSPRSSSISRQEANCAAISEEMRPGSVSTLTSRSRMGPVFRNGHEPRRRETVGQIAELDRPILEREFIVGRNIIDDDIEEAMVPLARDVSYLASLLNRKMPVWVIARSYFVDLAYGIRNGRGPVERQKHRHGPCHHSNRLLFFFAGAEREHDAQHDVVSSIQAREGCIGQCDDDARRVNYLIAARLFPAGQNHRVSA